MTTDPRTARQQRTVAGIPTPSDLALLDQARAEAADDLRRLRDAYRTQRQDRDEPAAVSLITQGLLDEPSWTRLELATALIEAVAILEARP